MISDNSNWLASKPGCRSTLKRPYDIKKWNKAELLEEVRNLRVCLSNRDQAITELDIPWYKKLLESLKRKIKA